MDVVCIIAGALLMGFSGSASEGTRGVIKTIGIFVLIIGIVWFVLGLVNGFNRNY